MLNLTIVGIVDFCARHRWAVMGGGLIVGAAASAYAIANFSITTDIEALISQKLPWHERQLTYSREFPQRGIVAVVEAPTPETAAQATSLLLQKLRSNPKLFREIRQ